MDPQNQRQPLSEWLADRLREPSTYAGLAAAMLAAAKYAPGTWGDALTGVSVFLGGLGVAFKEAVV